MVLVMNCSFPGCQYATDQDLTAAMSPTLDNHLTMIGIHIQGVHQPVPAPPPPPPPQIQPPPLQNVTRVRPPELRLEEGKIEEPDWDAFIAEWEKPPDRHRETSTRLRVRSNTNKSIRETGASCIRSSYRTRVAGPSKTPCH